MKNSSLLSSPKTGTAVRMPVKLHGMSEKQTGTLLKHNSDVLSVYERKHF